jgi:hypothetical protein
MAKPLIQEPDPKARSENDINETSRHTKRRRGGGAAATRHRSRSAPKLPVPNLSAPSHADQEADAERDAHGC